MPNSQQFNLSPMGNAQANSPRQQSEWEKLITQLLISQKVGSKAMGGFALGQILAALLKNWRSNYDQRGEMRREWEPLTPEERAKRLADIRQQNPAQADAAEKFMQERGFDFGATPQTQPQVQQSQITPQISAPISQAGQQSMPNADWQNQQQLLGNAADWEKLIGDLARRRSALGGGTYGF